VIQTVREVLPWFADPTLQNEGRVGLAAERPCARNVAIKKNQAVIGVEASLLQNLSFERRKAEGME
jgi:hypothetical protein